MAGICASEMSRRIAYGSVLCLCKGNNIQARWFYVYRHGRPFSRRLVAVHKWLVYRQRLEHRLFLHAQQPFGTGLKIAAWAGGVIRGGAVFRLVFICLAVIVILQFPSISLGAAVAGIFSYRVLVFADVLTARLRR